MTAIGRIIAVGSVCLLAVACGPGADFTGTWKGSRPVQRYPGANDLILDNYARVELTITSGGSFELFDQGLPRSGVISTSGKRGSLETQSVLGRKPPEQMIASPIQIVLNKDGTMSYTNPNTGDKNSIVLRRTSPTGSAGK